MVRIVIGVVLAGATASGALAADLRQTPYEPYTVLEEVILPRGPRYVSQQGIPRVSLVGVPTSLSTTSASPGRYSFPSVDYAIALDPICHPIGRQAVAPWAKGAVPGRDDGLRGVRRPSRTSHLPR